MNRTWIVGSLSVSLLILLVVEWRAHSRAASHHAQTAGTARPSSVSAPRPDRPPLARSTPAERRIGTSNYRIDFCGIGEVSLDPDDPYDVYRHLNATTRVVGERWLAALLDSSSIRARATGLILKGKIAQVGLVNQLMTEESRNALVQLAVGANDPAVYALAAFACNTWSDSAANLCPEISLGEWTRIDPDNAVPWLLLAAKAHAQDDPVGESTAFAHAARAHNADSYNYSLLAFAEPEMPTDISPLARRFLAQEVDGVEGAMFPPRSIMSKHCTDAAMHDVAVRQQCAGLAEVMVDHGTTLIDLAMGANLGARAGWSKKRVSDLRSQFNTMTDVIAEKLPNVDEDLWTCDGVTTGNDFDRLRVELGEVGALRLMSQQEDAWPAK